MSRFRKSDVIWEDYTFRLVAQGTNFVYLYRVDADDFGNKKWVLVDLSDDVRQFLLRVHTKAVKEWVERQPERGWDGKVIAETSSGEDTGGKR